ADYAPNSASYYRNLGTLYVSINWAQEAIETYQASMFIRETPVVYFFLADIYIQHGDYATASEIARQGHAFEYWSDLPYLSWGKIASEQNQVDEAVKNFRAALFRNPQSGAIAAQSATLANSSGVAEALKATQAHVGYQLGFASSVINVAQWQLALGDVDAALASGEQ